MNLPRTKVARGLLLYGEQIRTGAFSRKRFVKEIGVDDGTFRSASGNLGGKKESKRLRFFDSSQTGKIAFGPSAGLALGISLGHQSLRASLVDANGISRATFEAPGRPGQLEEEPAALLDRIAAAAGAVVEKALTDDTLKVGRALPFLGVSVAWPTPLTRGKLPVGHALAHHAWRSGTSVTNRVANHLGIDIERSHAMNDSAAAAIAVAYAQTMRREHLTQEHPRLTVTLRLAGGISAGMVVVEPPQRDPDLGVTSGFPRSVLIGGVDHHSGEIGHVPINAALVEMLNKREVEGLGPLVPQRCSCSPPENPELCHLESFAGGHALAARVDSSRPAEEVIDDIVANPDDPIHERALEDIGILVGDALIAPLAMLNPAAIVLTGSLALAPAEKGLRDTVKDVHRFGSQPGVSRLEDRTANEFARARGAALLVLRRHVYRDFPNLLDGTEEIVCEKIEKLTKPLVSNPWGPLREAEPAAVS